MLQHDSINQNETKSYKPTAVEKLLHVFNNLLAVIVGYCEKIQIEFSDIGDMSTNIDYIFTKIQEYSYILNELYFNQKQLVSLNRLALPVNNLKCPIIISNNKDNNSSRVFLIEDDDELNEIIRYYLCKHGYTVVSCSKGSEALAIFNNPNAVFAIYIIDVELPDIKGPDLIKNLLLKKKDINVLFISGYNEGILKKRYDLMDQYPILFKPFRLEGLLFKIKSTITH
jgi:CheY-like chemotaxis protein